MKNRIIISVLVIFLCFNVTGCFSNQQENDDNTKTMTPISKDGFLLGTLVIVKIYDSENEKIFDEAFDRLKEIEDRMSINIEDSDVSRINKNAGVKSVEVHDDVYFVIQRAKEYAKITNGAFDPTIGPLVKLWGIGTADARIPSQSEINDSLFKVDYDKLKLLDDNKVFLEDPEMILDLGAIAKGYAADETKRILLKNGVKSAIIDLGGNIFAVGSKPDGSPWRIGIQSPYKPRGNHVGVIPKSDISVVASGDYERYFEENDKRYHHIIDSSTGYPVWNNVAGVSVLSENSIDGDALSTALFVLGVDKGIELIEGMEGIDVIYITKDNKIYISSQLKDEFELADQELELIIP